MLKTKLNKTLIKYRSLGVILSIFVLLIAFFTKADSVNFYKTNTLKVSDEINIHSLSPLGLEGGSVVSASCGVPSKPWRPCSACNSCGMCNQGQTQCTLNPPTWCTAFPPSESLCATQTCTNGATNPPDCNVCPGNTAMLNGQCMVCNYAGCSNNICLNGATNPPTCSDCPAGKFLSGMTNKCEYVATPIWTDYCTGANDPNGNNWQVWQYDNSNPVQYRNSGRTCSPNSCTNDATNYPTCDNNKCTNGATNYPTCNKCQSPAYYWNGSSCIANPCGSVVPPANYGQSCNGAANACGQHSTGTIQCSGSCSAGAPSNNDCIQTFIPNTTSVQPNGSVEFFYKLLPVASGTSRTCGFYDRSQSKGPDGLGVPIPGLQNLNTDSDRIRINNIQRNTEFCLVCRFTTSDGTPQAPAANHQWVRVIRIGEN